MKDVKTSEIQPEDIRPCDFCKGPIVPIFRVLDVKMGAICQGARELVGYAMMGFPFGIGNVFRSLPVAEVCEEGTTRLFVCNNCWCENEKLGAIIGACEKVRESKEEVR